MWKFRSSLFKGLAEPPSSAVAPRKARNSFILPKRHRRVNFRQRRKEGNRTSGGFPLYNKANLNFMSAFFFETKGAKKKAWQKRTRRKIGFAACARRPTLRALDQRELLEKLDQNFQQTRREVTYKSKFELQITSSNYRSALLRRRRPEVAFQVPHSP